MKAITTHFAKTHLSRLLKEVQAGETIIILQGKTPVGKLTSALPVSAKRRPKPGVATSTGVRCAADAFLPLSDAELKEWGL